MDKKLKEKNLCFYKTNFLLAAFNQSMKNTFLNKSKRVKGRSLSLTAT